MILIYGLTALSLLIPSPAAGQIGLTGKTKLHQQTDTAGLNFPLWIQIAQDSALCLRPYQVQDLDQAFRRLDKLEELYLISTDALLSANQALEAQETYSVGLEDQIKKQKKAFRKKKRKNWLMGLGLGLSSGIITGLVLQ